MKVIIKRVGRSPQVTDIENELEVMQQIVGGYIEYTPTVVKDVLLVYDDDGKLAGKPVNFMFGLEPIAGDVFFASKDGSEFAGLTEQQIEQVMQIYF